MITFNELAANQLVPLVATETNWTAGRETLPTLAKRLLLVGYKTAAGSAALNTVYRLTSDTLAATVFGAGSQLHVMTQAALNVSSQLAVFGIAYAEGAGVAASGTITYATDATGSGQTIAYVGGRRYATGISSGDTPTEIAAALKAVINADTAAPFTADNALGVLTATAKNKGESGNSIRLRVEITSGIGTTATASAVTLASGATEGDPATALAATAGTRYHQYVINTDQSTQITALETHLESVSSAIEQEYGSGAAASTGASSAADALSVALDNKRTQVLWSQSNESPVFELAAAFGALRAATVDRKRHLDNVVLPGIKPPSDSSVWPTRADEAARIENGVVPLRPHRNGTVTVVRNVTTWTTGTPTNGVVDAEIIEISDYVDEYLNETYRTRFSGMALKVSSAAGTAGVLTPKLALDTLHECLMRLDTQFDYLQGVETDIKNNRMTAQQNEVDASRLDLSFPFRVVHGAHVITLLKTYTTPLAA